jgi:competence protein ComEC
MKQKRLLLFAGLLVACIGFGTLTHAQTMRAHVIDVGQGAATLLEFSCAAILIDSGGEKNGAFESEAALMDYLETFFARRADLKNTLHSFILTHPHPDHVRGVKDVLLKYRVLHAVTNGQEGSPGAPGQKLLHKKVIESEETPSSGDNIRHIAVWAKDVPPGTGLTNDIIDPVRCDDVDPLLTVLWGQLDGKPAKWTKDDFTNENNHSVVVRLDFGKASMLISGDLEDAAIPLLLAHHKGSSVLDVDVYQTGHHGSHNATTSDFLRAMTPQIAVIAVGPKDRETLWTAWKYGHPREATMNLLQQSVTKKRSKVIVPVATAPTKFKNVALTKAIYATAWDGSIVLEADVNGVWKVLKAGAALPPLLASGALPSTNALRAEAVAPASRLINLNTASTEELSELPMIGPTRAQAIVRYRTENEPFGSVDDILKVRGIGPGTLSAIRHRVRTR